MTYTIVEAQAATPKRALFMEALKRNRTLLLCEAVTVLVLVGTALVCARPELEGWGAFAAFLDTDRHGVWGAIPGWPSVRPLESYPLLGAWWLGHGSVWALGFVYGLELAVKYVVARWAVSPMLRGANGWLVATLAAVMLPWAGQWRGHNMAQQFAAIFMLVALGAAIRLRDRFRVWWVVLAALGITLCLLAYPALVLCVFALPFVLLFMNPRGIKAGIAPALRAIVAVIAGLILTGTYLLFAKQAIEAETYEEGLLASAQKPIENPVRLLTYLYRTAYVEFAWTPTLLVALLACLVGVAILALPTRRMRVISVCSLAAALIVLPLLSLPYALNFYFLSEPERVGYPLAFGFLLLCVTALIRFPQKTARTMLASAVLVVGVMAGSTANAYNSFRPFQLQRSVLSQVVTLANANPTKHIVVRDFTGTLGTRYTFQTFDTLSQALSVNGVDVFLQLCQPTEALGVPGPGFLPLCDSLAYGKEPSLVLDVKPSLVDSLDLPIVTVAGFFKVGNHPIEGLPDTTVIKGSTQGREQVDGKDFWWINSPNAVISIHNSAPGPAPIKWTGVFTAPSCPGPVRVRLTLDGKAQTYPVTAGIPRSVTTDVAAGATKLMQLQVIGKGCNVAGADKRTFYVGVLMDVGFAPPG